MYRPDLFRVDDVPRMHALMRARPFAVLVTAGASGLYASHFPTVVKDVAPFGVVEFHLARANPHWKELAEGNEALMIFQGPEGYITPGAFSAHFHLKAIKPALPNWAMRDTWMRSTNQMAVDAGDFEKGEADGAYTSLSVIGAVACAWRGRDARLP